MPRQLVWMLKQVLEHIAITLNSAEAHAEAMEAAKKRVDAASLEQAAKRTKRI